MLASLLQPSAVQESPSERLRSPVEDAALQVITASGSVLTVVSDDWALDRENHRV